jgi:preprotein translocase subunit SecD
MKVPKLKLNLNIKPLLNYVLIIGISSLFIAAIFVALPFTEKYISKASYNLNTKSNDYWSGEYILTPTATDSKTIDETRDIIYKRLKGFGVEEASVSKDGNNIDVVVTTSKSKDLVAELISDRFDISIVTRKSDVNFDDTANPYAYILASNYDSTEWTRESFRDVYITQLKTTSNSYAYFAIFKLWPNKVENFNSFLTKYNGQYIGVSIDGFVTPYSVDDTNKTFAVAVSTSDAQELKALSLLYNSGVIKTDYTLASQQVLTPNIPSVNYIQLTIGIFIAIVVLYVCLFVTQPTSRKTLLKSMLATTLTISIYLSFLKIAQIPVDTFILPIEAILAIILIRVIAENKDSILCIEVMLLLVCTALIFLGNGYIAIVAQDMLILTVLAKLCLLLSGWYINKVKKI